MIPASVGIIPTPVGVIPTLVGIIPTLLGIISGFPTCLEIFLTKFNSVRIAISYNFFNFALHM